MASEPATSVDDRRLYVPEADSWTAHIKGDGDKDYCCAKRPGEDFFHRLSRGEIYVSREFEKYCLDCATRFGFITANRMYWQRS